MRAGPPSPSPPESSAGVDHAPPSWDLLSLSRPSRVGGGMTARLLSLCCEFDVIRREHRPVFFVAIKSDWLLVTAPGYSQERHFSPRPRCATRSLTTSIFVALPTRLAPAAERSSVVPVGMR